MLPRQADFSVTLALGSYDRPKRIQSNRNHDREQDGVGQVTRDAHGLPAPASEYEGKRQKATGEGHEESKLAHWTEGKLHQNLD